MGSVNFTVLINWLEPCDSSVVTRQRIVPFRPAVARERPSAFDHPPPEIPPKVRRRRDGHGRLVRPTRLRSPDVHEIDEIGEGVGDRLLPRSSRSRGSATGFDSAAVLHHDGEVSHLVRGQPVVDDHRGEQLTILETLRGWPDPQGAPPRRPGRGPRPRPTAGVWNRSGCESLRGIDEPLGMVPPDDVRPLGPRGIPGRRRPSPWPMATTAMVSTVPSSPEGDFRRDTSVKTSD